MEDFDIELMEADQKEHKAIQLPLNFLTIGEVENDDVKVYIKQRVYKALEEYASSDTSHELGTVLIGNEMQELGKVHVVISDYIIAKYTDASASTLTFTHATWDYVHREHDEKYPDKKIVGWQHTHPGYGIFLSNYDMFIQENFFNVPFQVAYVIDPVQHIRGFFQWKNGRVEKLQGFYIYDDLGQMIKIEHPKNKKSENRELTPNTVHNRMHMILTAALSMLTTVLLVLTISLSYKYNEQADTQTALRNQIAVQNGAIENQMDEIIALRNSIEQLQLPKAEPSNDDTMDDKIVQENDDGDCIGGVQSGDNEDSQNGLICFEAYKVQAGDTLVSICNRAGIDYYSTYHILLSVNGITDANQIYVGQTVLLPVER